MAKFTVYNWAVVMLMALGQTSVSYSLSAISGALGQPNFYVYMNLTADPSDPRYSRTSNYVSATTGTLLSGGCLGVCLTGWLADRLGRKLTLQIGAITLIIGGALQAASIDQGMFLAARVITGIGMGSCWTTIPMYQAELATPASRGFMVSMSGVMFALGYMLSGWINFGTYYGGVQAPNSTWPWRFPLAMQILPMVIMLLGSPALPEAPRWLVKNERHEEGMSVLTQLHAQKDDTSNELARREYDQISTQIAYETVLHKQLGSFALIRTSSNRMRAFMGVGILVGCQFLGLSVVGTYGVLVYSSLGMTGSIPLLLQAIWVSISLPGNFLTALFVDKLGRRVFLLIGSIGILICLVVLAVLEALYLRTTNIAGQKASIFIIFLMIVFWCTCMDATQFVYLSEIYPNYLRAQGQALGMLGWMVSGIILLVAAPIAMDKIGWKFLLVNISCTVAFIISLYLFYPETRLKSIEDINAIFGDTVVLPLDEMKEKENMYAGETAKESAAEGWQQTEGGNAC